MQFKVRFDLDEVHLPLQPQDLLKERGPEVVVPACLLGEFTGAIAINAVLAISEDNGDLTLDVLDVL